MQPEFVDGDVFFVFKLEGPFAAVFVLRIFPFWAHALLEEVVVGFLREVGGRCDVVLDAESISVNGSEWGKKREDEK